MIDYQQEVLKAVLAFHDLGYCPLPVSLGSKSLGGEWKQYQTERPSREQVEKWFSDGKDHNIRIICGEVSGNLVVIDFDDKAKLEEFLSRYPQVTNTPIAMTARGGHIYLRTEKSTRSTKIDGIDIQGEGKYVIAPPSIHPSGIQYKWLNPEIREPLVIKDLTEVGIVPRQKPRLIIPHRPLHITPETLRPKYAREFVPRGERWIRTFKVALYFANHYLRETVEEMMLEWANQYCEGYPEDKFNEEKLRRQIENAYNNIGRRL